jgi:hypothetical protein
MCRELEEVTKDSILAFSVLHYGEIDCASHI